jgi:hypothetical protein
MIAEVRNQQTKTASFFLIREGYADRIEEILHAFKWIQRSVDRFLGGATIMSIQAIAYVQRKRITDWKRLVLTHHAPAFVYGSNDDRVFRTLPPKAALWIVSPVPRRSPELVAKLHLEKVRCRQCPDLGVSKDLLQHFREFKWIAKGTDKSRFFGHNDAAPVLLNTVFESSSGSAWKLADDGALWKSEYGKRLQRPTKLSIPKGNGGKRERRQRLPLEKLAAGADQSIFISWKWKDHPKRLPLCLAHELARRGFMVWLDHLALPDSRALKKVQKDKDKLERLLRYGYRQCAYLMAIESKDYGNPSPKSAKNWTLREWKGTLARGTKLRRVCFRPKGSKKSPHISSDINRLKAHDPEEAAQEFCELVLDRKMSAKSH